MSAAEAVQGLNCPKCGGMVPVPEGQAIVICPFCQLRSVVRGERGLRRYQVPCRIDRAQAETAFRKFLTGNWAIARDASSKAQLTEGFIAYLPFWMNWGKVMAWTFGEKRTGGEHPHYEPQEIQVVEEMTWNGAACDVGEFGVNRVSITDQQLEPYQVDELHRRGLVFEPVGSLTDAQERAMQEYRQRIQSKSTLDRVSQQFVRVVRPRMGLVYFPLWVLRYLYRGRSFQVVVDGYTGKVLYGKAPGNTLYRAGMLVGGMAAGSVLMVDVTTLLLSQTQSSNDNGLLFMLAAAFLGGAALMWAGYRRFRYGEQYEYRSGPKTSLPEVRQIFSGSLDGQVGEMIRIFRDLEK